MLLRTEGIVLKTNRFGEADLIVTWLTSDHGIVKTFAKSPRKTKSRFGSSLEPLTNAKIAFWGKEDAALPRLTQADIIHSFNSVRTGFKCFLRVSEIAELTLNFMPERDACKKAYGLLMRLLHSAEADCDAGLLFLCCKLRLLEIVGFLPALNGCGRCGSEGNDFYLSHGTVLCGKCSSAQQSPISISPAAVKLHSSLLEWDFSKIGRIKPSERLVAELTGLTDEHIRYVMEKDLKTRSFLNAASAEKAG